MSKFDSNSEKQAKSQIYLDRISPEYFYILFLSNNRQCQPSEEIRQKIKQFPEFNEFINIMTIETLRKDGDALPNYIKGTPTLIIQHKRSGQIAKPMEGSSVFTWFKELIKPQSGSTADTSGGSGVSITATSRLHFDPSRIDSNSRDPSQFQIPIEKIDNTDDINARLAELSNECKEAWSIKK